MSDDLALRVSGLGVRLGDYDALRDVSFELEWGGFLAVLGPNGAGKTTLLRALLGLVEVASGSIEIAGHPAAKAPRSLVGYVPQTKNLNRGFPALVIELVANGLRGTWPLRLPAADRERSIEALRRVGAEHLARREVGQLSGGELQRVYTARALVHRPRLVLLDEPAAGMDFSGERDLYDVLDGWRAETGAAVVMITHDWDVSYHHATRALLLQREVIGFGEPSEALSEKNVRRAFGHVGHHHPVMAGLACASHDHSHTHAQSPACDTVDDVNDHAGGKTP